MSTLHKLGLITLVPSACLLMLAGFAVQAQAATTTQRSIEPNGDFIIGPGKTEISLEPGESTSRTITVTNRTGETNTFEVELEDFTAASGTTETVELLGDQRGPASLIDLLNPEIDEFTLEQGEEITFQVDVSAPANAEPGGRYGAVIISNAPDETQTGTARLTTRVASLFLVRIEGDIEESGEVTDFRVAGPSSIFLRDNGPDQFELLFENTGNVHLTPYGQIVVENTFGQTVNTLPIDAYFALPDSTRYRAIANAGDALRIGRYTANLQLNRGYGSSTDYRTVSYWVIPWRILLGALFVIFLISAIVRWFKNRFELKRK